MTQYHFNPQLFTAVVLAYLISSSVPSQADVGDSYFESFEGSLSTEWIKPATSSYGWAVVPDQASDGTRSLRSATIAHGESAAIEWTHTFTAGELAFDYRIDAESCCDHLSVYLDNVQQPFLPHTSSWSTINLAISAGTHTIRWVYSKDGSVSAGADAAWIDRVRVFVPPPIASGIGNILTVANGTLSEYIPTGLLVQRLTIPGNIDSRDVIVTSDHRVAVADVPTLRVLDPANRSWITATVSGWSNGGNISYGGLAAYKTWIIASDVSGGLIRFNLSDLSSTRFLTSSYVDVTLGLDNRLYALRSSGSVDVINPDTMVVLSTVALAGTDNRSAIANAAGEIFAVDWNGTLRKLSTSGAITASVVTGANSPYDIDLDGEGRIVTGGRFGRIVVTNQTLAPLTFFDIGGEYGPQTFVAIVTDGGVDTDSDGIPDWWENKYGLNANNASDAAFDGDTDGASNSAEYGAHSNPTLADTDGDGLSDGAEIQTYKTSPLRIDTDSDGLGDGAEINLHRTDPLVADTDGDTLFDGDEINVYATNPLSVDSDGDSMPDNWELSNGLNPKNASDGTLDGDTDGLPNAREYAQGTNPRIADTDSDGLKDGAEVNTHHTNPLVRDTDGDRIIDGVEVTAGLNPLSAVDAGLDQDNDGFTNLQEAAAGSNLADANSTPVVRPWAMYQGNAGHTGYVPLLLNSTNFTQRWSRTSSNGNLNPVVAADGKVFLSTDSYFSNQVAEVLDAITGDPVWSYAFQSATFGTVQSLSPPSFANGKLFLHTGGHEDTALWAFNAADGNFVFRAPHDAQWPNYNSPTLIGDRAFMAGGYYGGAVAIDTAAGSTLWTTSSAPWVDSWEPAADASGVYTIYNGAVTVLNPANGLPLFSINGVPSSSYGMSAIPVLGSLANVLLGGDVVRSFDIATRTTSWTASVSTTGTPAVGNGEVYVVSNGRLVVLSETTGAVLWQWQPTANLTSNIVVTASHAFVATAGTTYAVDLSTHLPVWSYPLGGALALSNEGALYIVNGATIVAINVEGDQDGDEMADWWERTYGLNPKSADDALLDPDADGLSNLNEFKALSNPSVADTDGDGLADGAEVNTYHTDPRRADTDGDKLSDGAEILTRLTDPLKPDTDGDLLYDGDEVNVYHTNPRLADSDSDGMPDNWELNYSFDPNNAANATLDVDGDGLTNVAEYAARTHPRIADTDEDGLSDGAELNTHLTDPLNADSDGDFIADGAEIAAGLNPNNAADAGQDADSDGYTNLQEFYAGSAIADANSKPVIQAWTTFQGNAGHTGYVPVILDSAVFKERWKVTVNSAGDLNPATAADGKIFVTSSSYFNNQNAYVLSGIDGSVMWSRNYGGVHSVNPPAYANGTVYLQTGNHSGDTWLRAYNADTGAEIFKSPHGAQWESYYAPTVFDGNIYINGGGYGGAYAFDGTSGAQQWFIGLNQYDEWTPAVNSNYVFAYTGENSPQLTVIDRLTGTVAYSIADTNFDWNGWSMDLAPVLGARNNVLAIHDGRLISFDLDNRRIGWELNSAAYNFTGQPSVANGVIYAINSGSLQARKEVDGSLLWSWTPNSGALTGPMIVTANLLFASTGVSSYAVDLTSHQSVWSYAKGGALALSNEGALIIVSGGDVITIDVEGDADADGLPSWWERSFGLNPKDAADATLDGDSDGLTNLAEFAEKTDPRVPDTDADGLLDGAEANTYKTNPRNPDTDGDTLTDGAEVTVHNTDPKSTDTDKDGLADTAEVLIHRTNPLSADSDNDTMPDQWEVANGFNPLLASDADSDADSDGLINKTEYTLTTNPKIADSDDDGLFDGAEVNIYGTAPLSADSDGDLMSDGWEVFAGLNPKGAADALADPDHDGFNNAQEYFAGTDPFAANSLPAMEPWSTHQGNARHDGYAPLVLDPANFTERWNTTLVAADLAQLTQPVEDANGIYVVNAGWFGSQTLFALNPQTGAQTWKRDFIDISSVNPPAVADGIVYIQTGKCAGSCTDQPMLRAYAATDGTLAFRAVFGAQWESYLAPTPFRGQIYINGGTYGGAYSFSAKNGAENWFTSLPQYDDWTPAVTEQDVIAYAGPQLSVLDRSTGVTRFTIPDSNNNWLGYSVGVAPALGTRANALVTQSGRLISFDLANRKVGWELFGDFRGQAAVANGVVYVNSTGALSARKDTNGDLLWSWEPLTGAISAPMVITASHAFVSTGTKTYAVNLATHKTVWTYDIGGQLALSHAGDLIIAAANGHVINISVDGDMDGDLLPDVWEKSVGLSATNAADAGEDQDADGLTALDEFRHGTHPMNSDTDGDALTDHQEITTYATNPANADSDDDGLEDGAEVRTHVTDPNKFDSDDDGLGDGAEVEMHKTNPTVADTDKDGLGDGVEVLTYLTNPLLADTDGDSVSDSVDTDPLNAPRPAPVDSNASTDGAASPAGGGGGGVWSIWSLAALFGFRRLIRRRSALHTRNLSRTAS